MRRILASVTDKTGLEKFGVLVGFDWEIISTGGTAKYLAKHGIPHIPVEDVTHFSEMLDGRLKTLHPNIHGGILADRDNSAHMRQIRNRGIEPIDLVVVNLYNFRENPGIENIDIGGPTLIRAAAKSGNHVVAIVDPNDYDLVIREILEYCHINNHLRSFLFTKVFWHTYRYDRMIYKWAEERFLRGLLPIFPPTDSGEL